MLGLTSLNGGGGTAGGEAGLRWGLAEKGGRGGGGGGCSAGGTTTPLLPCCRRDASGPGAEGAVPARAASSVVTEAVDSVGVGRSDCEMHRCESVGRLDLAAAGSLPPSKSLLLYLVR
ncbi:uncharacterized protein LOC142578262 [Dermacentor variabilis]|uniref:uncharacterized protein LOC142578262 n=1 Tax=Dermacentor variabilis TaxID=34621 RepID=UPI003F5B0089